MRSNRVIFQAKSVQSWQRYGKGELQKQIQRLLDTKP